MPRFAARLNPIASAFLVLSTAPVAWAQTNPQAAPLPPKAASAPSPTRVAQAVSFPQVKVQGERDAGEFNPGTSSLSKLPDLRDAPQSVTIMNKALLTSQGANSLADALRNVPGITLGGAEGGQIGNNINLNGFTARTDIYLDGFRDRGQYYRDTFALDSVEVLMGPSSMLFGRGSTGGVINQVTKRPTLKASTDITGSATTNGMVRATADTNQPLGETSAVRVAVMGQSGKPTTRDEMKNHDAGIAPSARFGIGTPTEIVLSALVQHNHDMPDYGVSPLNGRPVPVDRDRFYGFTDDRTIQDVNALTASINVKLTPTASLRNQTSYNAVRVNAVETASQVLGTVGGSGFVPTAPAGISALSLDKLSVRLQSHDRAIKDKSYFNQTEFKLRLENGAIKQDVLAGADIGRDTYSNQAYFRNGTCNGVALNPAGGTSGYVACEPLINPTYTVSPGAVPTSRGNLSTSQANSLAGFVNDTVEFSPQFKFVGGLRYDHFQASIQNTLNSSNVAGNTTAARIDQTVSYTSVRTGGIWQPSDAQSYYASYSTSFNPSLEQLTNTTGTTAPLAPEKNRAYELGGKWDPAGGKLSANAAVFRITKYNARSLGSDGNYIADGTVRVQGARLGASGELAHEWKVFAGYAYLDAKIIDGIGVGTQGMVPLNTPKHSASVWTTFEFLPHWEAGGGLVYASSRFLNNTDTVRVDGYTRFDATLAYRQRAYDIRLNIFNLTNKYFYDALIQSDGGRAVPGTGRSAMVSFAYHM